MTDSADSDQRGASQDSDQAPEGTQVPPEGSEPPSADGETFPRLYVEQLRAESRNHRLRAERTDALETRLRALAITSASAGVLADPEALTWSDDYADAEGYPDPAKITAAAEHLAQRKPWLARPRGNVGQGEHSTEPERVSLSALLRS